MDFCTSLGVLCSAILAVDSSWRRFSASLAALSEVWETPYSPECVEGLFSELRLETAFCEVGLADVFRS
jgi:hypothetical protein